MDGRGSYTLGEIAARQAMIEIACRKCERRGRLHTAPLLARYGAALQMPDLLPLIAAGCLRLAAVSIYDRCGAHYLPHTCPPETRKAAPDCSETASLYHCGPGLYQAVQACNLTGFGTSAVSAVPPSLRAYRDSMTGLICRRYRIGLPPGADRRTDK